MSLTGGFDAVLQMADAALTETCTGLHIRGGLTHRRVRPYKGAIFDFVFDAPVLSAAAPQSDGKARVLVAVRAVMRARAAGNPSQVGRGGVATLTLRARLDPSTASGVALAVGDVLTVDWSETTAGDITVHSSDRGFPADATAALLDLLAHDATTVVSIGLLTAIGTRAVVPTTITTAGGKNVFAVGLDLSGAAGSTAQINGVLTADWAIALGADFVVARILDGLKANWGGLPPPNGSAAVVVQQGTICVLPTGLGCAATARQQIQLRKLTVALGNGKLTADGSIAQVVFGPLGFDIGADWSADVVLQVDSTGAIRAAMQNVVVKLSGLVSFFDALVGGRIQAAVEQAVSGAFGAGLGGTGMIGLLDGLIGGIGATSGATLRATSVDVRTDGIAIHGVVDGRPVVPAPIADVSPLLSVATPLGLLLVAGASWAPGSELAGITFAPGDGSTIPTAGNDSRLAAMHTYRSAGWYTAAVTVTNGSGAASTRAVSVEIGILRIRIASPSVSLTSVPGWQICGVPGQTVTFSVFVTASGLALAGVDVTVSGGSWSQKATTDARGSAKFSLSVDQVTASPASGGTPPGFSLGGFDVAAAATGWSGDRTRVWIVNCGGIGALQIEAQKLKDEWVARLEGYAALEQIRQQLGLTPTLPTGDLSLGGGVPPVDPGLTLTPPPDARVNGAAVIGAVQATLEQVTTLFAVAPGQPFVYQLLGLSPTAEPAAALKRLTSLWAGLDQVASGYQQTYGDRPR